MSILEAHNIQLKISKCTFYAREFQYLGQIISENGMRANPTKTEVIKNYPRPTTVKKLQAFLGLSFYFRRYVKNFSQISKPLTSLLKKEQPSVWTVQQQESVDKLKQTLMEDVLLAFPNFS